MIASLLVFPQTVREGGATEDDRPYVARSQIKEKAPLAEVDMRDTQLQFSLVKVTINQSNDRRDLVDLIPGVSRTGADDGQESSDVTCVEQWLEDEVGRSEQLQTWWQARGLKGFAVRRISNYDLKEDLEEFIKEQDIECMR